MEELALKMAKRYNPPDPENIWERDWVNQHAIFTINEGKVIFKDFSNKDYEKQFGEYRRNIVKKFIQKLDIGTFKLPFDASMHDFVGVQMNMDEFPHSILGSSILDTDNINIPVPDFYAMENYNGKLDDFDLMPFNHKVNRLLFIGGTTGDPDPIKNKRIKLCRQASKHEWIDAYISEVVQMPPTNEIYNYVHVPISQQFQKMYRHLISVDGNTAAWDRIPWIMASNSILWKQKSNHECWYYPLMKPNEHYIEFDEFPELVQVDDGIVTRAHDFVDLHLRQDGHMNYMKLLLQNIKELKEP